MYIFWLILNKKAKKIIFNKKGKTISLANLSQCILSAETYLMQEINVTSSIPPPSLLGDSGFDIFLGWGVEEKIGSL